MAALSNPAPERTPMAEPDVLIVHELAARLRAGLEAAYPLAHNGEILVFKVGSPWRSRGRDIEAWVDERTGRSSQGRQGNDEHEGGPLMARNHDDTAGSLGFEDKPGFRLAVPPAEVPRRFGAVRRPLFARTTANGRESTTVAAVCDSVLPKLISGELRVPEAKWLVEVAS